MAHCSTSTKLSDYGSEPERQEAKEDIDQAMYRELAALGPDASPEQRVAVVEKYQAQLEANGFFGESRELGGKITSLSLDGSKDVNFIRLQQDIATGEADVDDVNEANFVETSAQLKPTPSGLRRSRGQGSDERFKVKPKRSLLTGVIAMMTS